MVDITNFLDFYNLYFNELIGDIFLGVIVGLIIVILLTIKFKMPFKVSLLFGLIWLAIVFEATGLEIIWVFVVLAVGGISYYAISRIFNR